MRGIDAEGNLDLATRLCWSYLSLCACWHVYWRHSGLGLVLSATGGGGPAMPC